MSQANLGGNSARSTSKLNCTTTAIHLQWFGRVCQMDSTWLPYKLLWCRQPPTWKVHRCASKRTWAKQVEDNLKRRRLALMDAKTLSTDHSAWKQVVKDVGSPSEPTAAYDLRRDLRHNAKDQEEDLIISLFRNQNLIIKQDKNLIIKNSISD